MRTSQRQFDGDQPALERIARDEAGELDWVGYADDLRYVVLDPTLFRWAFPKCLELWRAALWGGRESAFTEHFHYALIEPRVRTGGLFIADAVPEKAKLPVENFFYATWLECAALNEQLVCFGQPERVYFCFRSLYYLGCCLPSLSSLFGRWFMCQARGHSAMLLGLVSTLVYDEADNPMFDVWRPDVGGGPPDLYMHCDEFAQSKWLDLNRRVFEEFLCFDVLLDTCRRAASRVASDENSGVADLIVEDCVKREDRIRNRLGYLERVYYREPREYADWPD